MTPEELLETAISEAITIQDWDYLAYGKDVVLTSDHLDRIAPNLTGMVNRGTAQLALVKQMTVAQFNMIPDSTDVSPERILSTTDATFADYKAKISGLIGYNPSTYNLVMSGHFFTEEEILENLEMFDPQVFRKSPVFYVTKKTMTALNKVHKSRFRAKSDFQDFNRIINARLYHHLRVSVDILIYLKEKTNTSNADVLKSLSNRGHMRLTGLESLLPLINILKD